MHNTTAVLIRNIEEFEDKTSLMLGLWDSELLSQWLHADRLKVWCNSFASYQAATSRGFAAEFSHTIPVLENIQQVIIVLPKSRELLNCWLAQLNAAYAAGTKVYLVGEKKAGIQGGAKQLGEYCDNAIKLDMARHCQLWGADLHGGGSFNLDEWQQVFTIGEGEDALQFASIPGVFKHGELDEGTALLLDNLGKIPSHRVLDFGCGAGVIGLHLKNRWPDATVEMLDASAEAVYASQQSAQMNNLDVLVYPSNGLSEVKGLFKAIYSNPPFHTGVRTDYSVTEQFIRDVAGQLMVGGELRIVANSFLKYPTQIEQHIGPCQIVAENKKFRVYSAIKKRQPKR